MLPHDDNLVKAFNAHYGHSEVGDRIRRALETAGADLERLAVTDLAPFDHLHGGGKSTTLHLARLAGVTPGLRIADLGGGIGGPARTLAAEFGCTVDVVDFTEEFCRVGTWLTDLTKLERQVHFYHASALQTPLSTGAYDLVWMQNTGMNINDRNALYAEVSRLLRPGGQYALQEVMVGPVSPVFYPQGWASTAETSFLYPPDEVHGFITAAGFRKREWVDITEETAADLRQRATHPGGNTRTAVYTPGDLSGQITDNTRRNYAENRIVHMLGVFEKR